ELLCIKDVASKKSSFAQGPIKDRRLRNAQNENRNLCSGNYSKKRALRNLNDEVTHFESEPNAIPRQTTLPAIYFFLSMKRRFNEAFHFCTTGSRRPSSAAASKNPTSLAPAGSLYER